MWTFERYQRWMDQVTDWVRPPSARCSSRRGENARPSPPRPAPSRSERRPSRRPSGAREDVIEVPVEDVDLDALAKKILERKS